MIAVGLGVGLLLTPMVPMVQAGPDRVYISCDGLDCGIGVQCNPVATACVELEVNTTDPESFIPKGDAVQADVRDVDVYLHDYHWNGVDYPCVSSKGSVGTRPGTTVGLGQSASCLPGGFSHSTQRLAHLEGHAAEYGIFDRNRVIQLCDAIVTAQVAGSGVHDKRVDNAVPCNAL